jgi:hypothetical protein
MPTEGACDKANNVYFVFIEQFLKRALKEHHGVLQKYLKYQET